MTDISKCDGAFLQGGKEVDCTRKEECWRYIAPTSRYQWYFMPETSSGGCPEFYELPAYWKSDPKKEGHQDV